MSENILKKGLEKKVPILILGAPGTGKSHLVQKIVEETFGEGDHCVHVNMAAIRPELLESELFGHVKGAFTGATSYKKGLIEYANNKVLFLDEIGELDLYSQAKILQVLEEKSFRPVGSVHSKKFSGTFVFATNKNLEEEIAKGTFREDLYHRIKGLTYRLESVRFFPEKIKELVSVNINLAPGLIEILCDYSWPGNYREINHFNDFCKMIYPEVITEEVFKKWKIQKSDKYDFLNYPLYHDALAAFEKAYLKGRLNKFHGKINQTSSQIKLSKSTLIAKIKKYDIQSASKNKFAKYKYLRALDV